METVKVNLSFYVLISLAPVYWFWNTALGLVTAILYFMWSEYEKKVVTKEFLKLNKEMLIYVDF